MQKAVIPPPQTYHCWAKPFIKSVCLSICLPISQFFPRRPSPFVPGRRKKTITSQFFPSRPSSLVPGTRENTIPSQFFPSKPSPFVPGTRENTIPSQFFPSRPSPFVPINGGFCYKDRLMDFAKAGGHLAEGIAQNYYDHNHNQAMVSLRRQQQENAMASFYQRQQEQSLPSLFLLQERQQQMNYRRILPRHQQWNHTQTHPSMLDSYNLNPPQSFSFTNGGMFCGAPQYGYGNHSVAQNTGFSSQLGVRTTSIGSPSLAGIIGAPQTYGSMFGGRSSEFGSYMGLPPLGAGTSTDGARSVPGFMETPATTPNLSGQIDQQPGQLSSQGFRYW